MAEPIWLTLDFVMAMHSESIAQFGGSPGLRDRGLLESALERPRNHFAYGDAPGLHELAAAYSSGIAHNHPFIDGNKRVALLVARALLFLNGLYLEPDEKDEVAAMLALADGKLDDAELASWLAANTLSEP